MKQAFDDIAENTALRMRLADDILGSTLSHAYIIEGERGSGKHMLALRIAAALSCEKKDDPSLPLPCRTCPSCRKILSGNSPDVIYIGRGDKATLGVEAIRNLKQDVYVAPNDVAAKVYIIEDAHLMTVQAQNAILKLLEEPPKNVYFMLLVENAASLLATVRSRAPILRMQVFTSEEIEQYLIANSTRALEMSRKSPDELSHIVARSGGSIGEALRIIDEGDMSQTLAKQAVELLAILTDKDRASLAVFPFPSKNREELSEFLSLVRTAIRDMTASRSMAKCEMLFGDDAKMTELSKRWE